MRQKLITALSLLAAGILLTILGSIKFERREEVFRIADFRATVPTARTVPAFRYVGILCIASGALLLFAAVRKPAR